MGTVPNSDFWVFRHSYTLDVAPTQDAIVANEGLGWDSRS